MPGAGVSIDSCTVLIPQSADRDHRSIVMSVFAIVILSVLGGMFKVGRPDLVIESSLEGQRKLMNLQQNNHHSLMSSTDDPENGAAVAGTIFSAVIVYAVRHPPLEYLDFDRSMRAVRQPLLTSPPGVPCLLLLPGVPAQTTERVYCSLIAIKGMGDGQLTRRTQRLRHGVLHSH
jgi:hypothetical protein